MENDVLKVIKPGSEIWIGHEHDKIKAKVLEVCIKPNGVVQYRVSWWASRDRKDVWLESFETNEETVFDTSKIKIGFR